MYEFMIFSWFNSRFGAQRCEKIQFLIANSFLMRFSHIRDHLSMSSSAWVQRNISSINKRINGENSIFWCFVGNSLLFFMSISSSWDCTIYPRKKKVFLWYFFAPIGEFFVCVVAAQPTKGSSHRKTMWNEISFMRQTTAQHFFIDLWSFFKSSRIEFCWNFILPHCPPPHDDRAELKMLHVINDLRRPQNLENILFLTFSCSIMNRRSSSA